jgi:nucleotide sugar dehydrogenase
MINVVGLGYIGLPTALIFAASGEQVIGSDCNEQLVYKLQQGRLNIDEDGMENLYEEALPNIKFSSMVVAADTYIVAVPTPYNKNSKKINPNLVIKAVEEILQVCPNNAVIVIESTVSPGTIDVFVRPIVNDAEQATKRKVHLVHAPERIIPGRMICELRKNARTIGADNPEIGLAVKNKYKAFCEGDIILTDIKTAEMTKVVENTYRDVNIAFANELSKICHVAGIDVHEVIEIANMHPRVSILSPGPGVGGHCIAVDPWFLVGDYPQLARLVLAARMVNESMPDFVMERMAAIMEENHIDDLSRVGIYGLSYKENIADTRESPSLQLLEKMKKHMAFGVKVYDPYVINDIVENQYHVFEQFLAAVDFVVVMVAHDEVRASEQCLKGKIVLDCKNVFDAGTVYRL